MDVLSRFPLAVTVDTRASVVAITMISSQKTVKVIHQFFYALFFSFSDWHITDKAYPQVNENIVLSGNKIHQQS